MAPQTHSASTHPDRPRQFAVTVVRRLVEHGYQALLAGGCVRDQLRGVQPKDYDVATSATPEQVRSAFGRRRTVPIGAAFGVMAVVGSRGEGTVEVATFRQDISYSDGRHPDAVQFSTPEHDAQRRDFTINGLFYDPLAERILDFVGGQADLERRIVRAIGDPYQRFREDHLRMLRAVRFAVCLEFTLDESTGRAIAEQADALTQVSGERVAQEMRLILAAQQRATGLRLLARYQLLPVVLPELPPLGPAPLAASDPWTLALQTVAELTDPDLPQSLAALLIAHRGVLDPAAAEHPLQAICQRWRLPRADGSDTRWLLRHLLTAVQADRLAWPQVQRVLIDPRSRRLTQLARAWLSANHAELAPVQFCENRLQWPPDKLNPDPLLCGDDLIQLGIPAGPHFRGILSAVRDAQLQQEIATAEQARQLAQQLWLQEPGAGGGD